MTGMRVYYLNAEYEPGKHKIMTIWSPRFGCALPEELPKTTINAPHTIIEIDEDYNRVLCHLLVNNTRVTPEMVLPDRFYVDNAGQIRDDVDNLVIINPNPQKESFKLSALYGLTQAQLETYIDTNVTTLATAKEYLKKLSAVVLWLVKYTKLD